MTALAIILVVAAAILAMPFIARLLINVSNESDRQLEIARVNRERRLAEARINRLTYSAMQQMSNAATPHGVFCQCARCVGRGGQR